MSAPPIAGVLETAIYVADLPRARAFYEGVLGLVPMFADARLAAYPVGASVLLVFLRGGTAETVALPGITVPVAYRAAADAPELTVHVVPSLIHYGETETLIGAQVLARGLLDHPDTFRWMKRAVAGRIDA